MPATMNDLQREREILNEELAESRFAFAESLKAGLGDDIKKELNKKSEERKAVKAKKPSFLNKFLKKLADICK
jgi:hypothetical protein